MIPTTIRVNPLRDPRWAQGTVCSVCGGHGYLQGCDATGDYVQDSVTCVSCSGTGRIPFARETCKTCPGSWGGWGTETSEDQWVVCHECKGTGTTPLHLVLASGECSDDACYDGYWIERGFDDNTVPCPTCHATGHALIDVFGERVCNYCGGWGCDDMENDCARCGGEGVFLLLEDDKLATLYASIASLTDTCIVNIVLADQASVERMRAWVKNPHKFLIHPDVKPDVISGMVFNGVMYGWPLTNIVYWTPGANGQLEGVVV